MLDCWVYAVDWELLAEPAAGAVTVLTWTAVNGRR